MGAVRVEVDFDPRLDEVWAQRTFRDLQLEPIEGNAIVVADLALLLDAQDLVEVDARDRNEGRARLGLRRGEARIVGGQIDLAEEGVGRLDRPSIPASASSFGSRSCRVWNARSDRPRAWGE